VVIRTPVSSLDEEVFKDKFLHLSLILLSNLFDFCLVRICLSSYLLLFENLCVVGCFH